MSKELAALVWAATVIAWGTVRYPYQLRARGIAVATKVYDRRERMLIAGATLGLFVLPLAHVIIGFPQFADYPFSAAMAWAGGVAMVLFLVVFVRSHRDLGHNFSVTLEIRRRHALVTNGIYRYVRHPMYLSFWLWAVGQALLFANWVVAAAGLAAVAVLYGGRVGREEQMLREAFGADYDAYCARTARLIPGIH